MKYVILSFLTLVLLSGCASKNPNHYVVKKQPTPIPKVQPEPTKITLPPAPKKNIKLKEVDDTNYSDSYMYPEDSAAAKKDPIKKAPVQQVQTATVSNTMSKEECITMISQEKFDKYTDMLGSEAASIKRCTMLKAMNQ